MKLTENRDGVFNQQPRSIGSDLPIALSYSVTLAKGQVSRPTEQINFKNPYRGPMWVDEFHFNIGTIEGTTPAQVIGMRLKLNDRYIIDEFVPFVLLGPHTDFSEGPFGIASFTTSGPLSFFWRLVKPLWVDELDDLLMEFNFLADTGVFTGFGNSITIDVKATLCGRATKSENRPAERYLPFNVVWHPERFDTVADVESNKISPDSALRNGRNESAFITRILGSMNVMRPNVSAALGFPTTEYLLNLRISHSLGYYLVKDLTPFYELFDNLSRECDLKFVLRSKEFLTVELQTETIVTTAPPYSHAVQPISYYGGFALQGYTVEKLS